MANFEMIMIIICMFLIDVQFSYKTFIWEEEG